MLRGTILFARLKVPVELRIDLSVLSISVVNFEALRDKPNLPKLFSPKVIIFCLTASSISPAVLLVSFGSKLTSY